MKREEYLKIRQLWQFYGEFRAKTKSNTDQGLVDLASGNTRVFPGYNSRDSSRIFNIGLIYDRPSSQRIIDRVAKPLSKLARSFKVPILVTGIRPDTDLAPHTVLDAGRFDEVNDDQIQQVQNILVSPDLEPLPTFPNARELKEALTGKVFELNELVVGANSYLTGDLSSDMHQDLLKARIAIRALMTAGMQQVGLEPLKLKEPFPYYNIFHSSVARINGTTNPHNLERFREVAHASINWKLADDPIFVRVERVHIGNALDFQLALGPQQVDKS